MKKQKLSGIISCLLGLLFALSLFSGCDFALNDEYDLSQAKDAIQSDVSVDYEDDDTEEFDYSLLHSACKDSIVTLSVNQGGRTVCFTGVIISEKGHVLTMASYADYSQASSDIGTLRCVTNMTRYLRDMNLAVYKPIQSSSVKYPYVSFQTSDALTYGEPCLGYGLAFDSDGSYEIPVEGIISNPRNTSQDILSNIYAPVALQSVVQADLNSNYSSGTPIFNSDGDLVGFTSFSSGDSVTDGITDVTWAFNAETIVGVLQRYYSSISYTLAEAKDSNDVTANNIFASANLLSEQGESQEEKELIDILNGSSLLCEVIDDTQTVNYQRYTVDTSSMTVAQKVASTKIAATVNLICANGDGSSASQGSGFIISSDGYFVSNLHVVNEEASDSGSENGVVRIYDYVYAGFANGYTDGGKTAIFRAQVVAYNAKKDIALLKFVNEFYCETESVSGFVDTCEFLDTDTLSGGERLVAIGNCLGYGTTVTHGVVSCVGMLDYSVSNSMEYIRTDVAINSGNSGGASFNEDGLVVGINSMVYVNYSYSNIGYVITANEVTNFLRNVAGNETSNQYAKIHNPSLAKEFVFE